MNTVNNGEFVR